LNILPLGHLPIDLTYNTHLRCVNFYFTRLKNNPEGVFLLSTFLRIGSRQLEQVVFHLSGPFRGDRDIPNTEWIKVDAILASPQFATLKDVHVYAQPRSIANLTALFAALLPTCHARGIISFLNAPP
jgi:hypothetical protein